MTLIAYDTVEEMFAAQAANQRAADARVVPWQADLGVGDYFVRSYHGFTIYHRILDPSEGDFTDEEKAEILADYAGAGYYRFCKAYSTMCEYGDLGDVHVSVAERKITVEEFEEARAGGW